MRHRKEGRKFGRESDHRRSLLHNLVKSLIKHERIVTTVSKAKEMRSLAERIITYGKADDLHHRRLAFNVLQDKDLVKKVFDEIAPRYKTREGGYTRVLKKGYRRGDCAPTAIIEFVEGELVKKNTAAITTAEIAKEA